MRISRLELARLNHIFIPETRVRRDQLRASRVGRALAPLGRVLELLTFEGAALGALLFFLGVFVFYIDLSSAHVFWGMASGYLVSALVFSAQNRLQEFDLQVRVPLRVRAGTPAFFQLRLRNLAAKSTGALRISLPFLPWDGKWVRRPLQPTSIPACGALAVECVARFEARGWHDLDPVSLSLRGWGGLASGPPLESGPLRFLVTPRSVSIQSPSDAFLQTCLQRGERDSGGLTGREEFRGLRVYQPGDPVRDLHARSWARIGKPMIQEREAFCVSRVGVLVDLAGDGLDGPELESLLELAHAAVTELERLGLAFELVLLGVYNRHLQRATERSAAEELLSVLRISDIKTSTGAPPVSLSLAGFSGFLEVSAGRQASTALLQCRQEALAAGIGMERVRLREDS